MPWTQVADKEAGANCPAALVHAARTRSRLGGKVKQRFQEGAVDEVCVRLQQVLLLSTLFDTKSRG